MHAPLSQSGGFSMLHCAALTGNTQIVMMLLQCGADVMALTDVRPVCVCSAVLVL